MIALAWHQDEDLFAARAALLRLEALTAVSATAASDTGLHDSLNRILEVSSVPMDRLQSVVVSLGPCG